MTTAVTVHALHVHVRECVRNHERAVLRQCVASFVRGGVNPCSSACRTQHRLADVPIMAPAGLVRCAAECAHLHCCALEAHQVAHHDMGCLGMNASAAGCLCSHHCPSMLDGVQHGSTATASASGTCVHGMLCLLPLDCTPCCATCGCSSPALLWCAGGMLRACWAMHIVRPCAEHGGGCAPSCTLNGACMWGVAGWQQGHPTLVVLCSRPRTRVCSAVDICQLVRPYPCTCSSGRIDRPFGCNSMHAG